MTPVILVSQWNAQCPACVFHFIHEAKKSEGMSLEVTSNHQTGVPDQFCDFLPVPYGVELFFE